MHEVTFTTRFRKDLKRCQKRGLDIDKFVRVMNVLRSCGQLPATYKPHKLVSRSPGQWECHLEPDWLVIWEQNDEQLTLLFMETGTHPDLFR